MIQKSKNILLPKKTAELAKAVYKTHKAASKPVHVKVIQKVNAPPSSEPAISENLKKNFPPTVSENFIKGDNTMGVGVAILGIGGAAYGVHCQSEAQIMEAEIKANSEEKVAQINADASIRIAQINATSQEKIAKMNLDKKK